jgi:hypothetical protein
MTEPRKLAKGQNERTAVIDAARQFIGSGDPRQDGGRVKGDPVDAMLAAASDIGSEHPRRYRSNTLHGTIEHAALASRRQQPQPQQEETPAAGSRANVRQFLATLNDSDRAALIAELDAQESEAILSTADTDADYYSALGFEATPEGLQAAAPMPWEGRPYEGYYETQWHAERAAAMAGDYASTDKTVSDYLSDDDFESTTDFDFEEDE